MPDCGQSEIPTLKAPDYCAPEYHFGSYSGMLLGSQDYVDITDLIEHTARIDNTTAADPTKVRQIYITGDKPAGSTTKTDTSGRRAAYAPKEQTFNFTVDDLNDLDRSFWQGIEEENGFNCKCWPYTPEDIWGGNTGYSVTITVDEIIPSSLTDTHKVVGTAVFIGSMGQRDTNPLG